MRIDRPIILIGTGRCGSTVVYEALALHEDVAWFSNYSDKFPRMEFLAALPRIYELPWLRCLPRGEKRQGQRRLSRFNRYLPKPGECYNMWEVMCGKKFSWDYLIGVRATSAERRRVQRAVRTALLFQGKSRFVNKITGPPRIEFLRSIFPDALFVHVVRDGRAVVNSLLDVDFWKHGGCYARPRWRNGLPEDWEEEWKSYGSSPMALAAIQVRTIYDVLGRERSLLASDQFIEIKYEDFVQDPSGTMRQIMLECGLKPSPRVESYVGQSRRYRSMNQKYLDRFSREEIEDLNRIMGCWLAHYGYL